MDQLVALVGFNNLRKLNSNHTLDIPHLLSSTTVSNPLARMFTRNKSQDTLLMTNQSLHTLPRAGPDSDDAELVATAKSLIKSLAKPRLRLGKLKKKKPELNVQTLFASFTTPKDAISASPVTAFHNLFHRNQGLPAPLTGDLKKSRTLDDAATLASAHAAASTEIPLRIMFSSNNSNSQVTDVVEAIKHNFVNNNDLLGPDDSVKAAADEREPHHALFELHRKLMVPTDHYLQKLKKETGDTETMGLGISTVGEYTNTSDYTLTNAQFFTALATLTRPVFVPLNYRHLGSGGTIPHVTMLMEEVLAVIVDHFCGRHERALPTRALLPLQHHDEKLDLRESYKVRAVAQDIETFCYKMLGLVFVDVLTPEINWGGQSLLGPVAGVMAEWGRLALAWTVFNNRIRFYLVGIFAQLFRALKLAGIDLDLDELVVKGFKHAAIDPVVYGRLRLEYDREVESAVLKQNPRLLTQLVRCVGVCCRGDDTVLPWLISISSS